MEKTTYCEIVSLLEATESVKKLEQLGMCRYWAAEVVSTLKKYTEDTKVNLEYEVREVEINNLLSHSFIRVIAEGELPLIIDAVGVDKKPPYIGYEQDAPPHLQNSHPDILNCYLKK
jgi:hypothetical protein